MTQGIPVVVSVQAGTFTTSGHIMVLALNKEGTIQVFDPNDSPKKPIMRKAILTMSFKQKASIIGAFGFDVLID